MTKIYHLALVDDWQQVVRENSTYYPPTYEVDGFTHATKDAERLIDVANHFYTDTNGDWVCLEMALEAFQVAEIEVRFEPAANVGDKSGELEGREEALFPHIYGGIHPDVVSANYSVIRDAAGHFVSIEFGHD